MVEMQDITHQDRLKRGFIIMSMMITEDISTKNIRDITETDFCNKIKALIFSGPLFYN